MKINKFHIILIIILVVFIFKDYYFYKKINDLNFTKKIDSIEKQIDILKNNKETIIKTIHVIEKEIDTNYNDYIVPSDIDSIRSILKDPYGYGYRVFKQKRSTDTIEDSLQISRFKTK